jgi:predicted secreted protein
LELIGASSHLYMEADGARCAVHLSGADIVEEHPPLALNSAVGEQAIVELSAVPGAGLIWMAASAPEGCSIERLENRDAEPELGGKVVQRFGIRCARAGRWQLRFEMKRPWEKAVRAVQPINIDVR